MIGERTFRRIVGLREGDNISTDKMMKSFERHISSWSYSQLNSCRLTLDKLKVFLQENSCYSQDEMDVSDATLCLFLEEQDETAQAKAVRLNKKAKAKAQSTGSKAPKLRSGKTSAPKMFFDLEFARDHLCLPFDLLSPSLRAMSIKPSPDRIPTTAISSSVKMLIHLERLSVAFMKQGKEFAAFFSSGFVVEILAMLRDNDAQTSKDVHLVESGSFCSSAHIYGCALEQKDPKAVAKRRPKLPMPWVCPIKGVTDEKWADVFLASSRWEGDAKDFIFRAVVTEEGLCQASSWGTGPCKKCLPFLHELLMLPPLSLTAEEAKTVTKHSNRHLLQEIGHVIGLPLEDRELLGRWKNAGGPGKDKSASMANRYSQEAAGPRALSVANKCLQAIKQAQGNRTLDEFFDSLPAFGGWDLLIQTGSPNVASEPPGPEQSGAAQPRGATLSKAKIAASQKFVCPKVRPGQLTSRHIVFSSQKTFCGRKYTGWTPADSNSSITICKKCQQKSVENELFFGTSPSKSSKASKEEPGEP